MKLGIVGHAQEKFTPETEQIARNLIAEAIGYFGATLIVSGHSPMGGVDIYAEEIAEKLGIETLIHAPTIKQWDSVRYGDVKLVGYRERNLAIARDSDLVLCIVCKELPPGYKGMKFKGCYHCKDRNPQHVKSGGCWTAWKCKRQEWRIIEVGENAKTQA